MDRLNGWGFVWNENYTKWKDEAKWEEYYSHLKKFYEDNNHIRVPDDHKIKDGHSLGNWVKEQRRIKMSLSKEKIDRLNDLGFVWKVIWCNS